jgi:hypothetical protein
MAEASKRPKATAKHRTSPAKPPNRVKQKDKKAKLGLRSRVAVTEHVGTSSASSLVRSARPFPSTFTMMPPLPPLPTAPTGGSHFTVGSDFAGLNLPVLALYMLGLGPIFTEVFASDKYPPCQRMIAEHFPAVEFIYGDVADRDVESMKPVDLYFSTFPCQPFSHAGRKLGESDPRGRLVHKSLEYIQRHRPRIVMFENVSNLYYKFRAVYNEILDALVGIGSWVVCHGLLGSGLPQQIACMPWLARSQQTCKPLKVIVS